MYHSVLVRRSKRQQQKGKNIALVRQHVLRSSKADVTLLTTAAKTSESRADDMHLTTSANTSDSMDDVVSPTTTSVCEITVVRKARPSTPLMWRESILSIEEKIGKATRRRSCTADSNRLANLKTAVMLFIVNVVFVVTFMPAFLMVIKLIPYNMTIFYFYFANNVANPVIYSFMNRNFRKDLVKIFNRRFK